MESMTDTLKFVFFLFQDCLHL